VLSATQEAEPEDALRISDIAPAIRRALSRTRCGTAHGSAARIRFAEDGGAGAVRKARNRIERFVNKRAPFRRR
jgi:hypothetical protein